MYPYFAHSSNPGRRYRQHQPTQHFQPYISFDHDSLAPTSRPTFFAQSHLDDDTDEEEQFLRAALERKRQEKQTRQQYRHQLQLEQQRQYAALMHKEQQYQQEQQAIARAKYEAEQKAILRYKRELRAQELKRQEQGAWESLVFHNLRQHQIESQRKATARAAATYQAQQRQVVAFFQEKPSSDDEAEDEALGALFQHLLCPLAKRTLVQEQSYPCKRRQQCERKELKHAQAAAEKEKEAKDKEAQKKQDQAQASSSKPDQDVAYIDLPTLLEAMLGVPAQTSSSPSSSECKKPDASASKTTTSKTTASKTTASKTTACAARRGACFATTANPSTSDSSPELRASDVLRQRQHRQQQQNQALLQKHSELNLIESALDELSRELTQSLSIYEETDEIKRQVVLATEENVTKAMFEIDSVESEGDLNVRQRRKELIKKSQDLLDTVDEYKKKESNTGKQVAKNTDESASGQCESESPAPEVEETRGSTVESDTAESVDLDEEVQAEEVEEEEEEDEEDEDEEEDVQPYVVSDTVPQEKDETTAEVKSAYVSDSVSVEESVDVTEETPVEKTPKAKATESADDDDMVVV
ncbi:hypothetical protein BGZ93_004756 [Podila epicladia]|nr:hypothetical protein BGZ93_004756 [Podila epicladia]